MQTFDDPNTSILIKSSTSSVAFATKPNRRPSNELPFEIPLFHFVDSLTADDQIEIFRRERKSNRMNRQKRADDQEALARKIERRNESRARGKPTQRKNATVSHERFSETRFSRTEREKLHERANQPKPFSTQLCQTLWRPNGINKETPLRPNNNRTLYISTSTWKLVVL